ncbi:MAG: hypothetical protein KGS72_22785 [Cyanobacteria bacterium REEB67]|nr:hypothetical protein [Cyanobacteria bacterium REEB67]
MGDFVVPALALDEEWVFQQCGDDLGEIETRFTPRAVRIDVKQNGFCLLASAPNWQVNVFRPRERVFWSCPLEKFQALILTNPFASPEARVFVPALLEGEKHPPVGTYSAPLKRTASGYIHGLAYSRYIQEGKWGLSVFSVADDIKVDYKIAELLCRFFVIPVVHQIPLEDSLQSREAGSFSARHKSVQNLPFQKMDYADDYRRGPVVHLKTKSWKKIAANPADFVLPPCRRVNDVLDVSYSPAMKNGLTNAADALYSDEKPAAKQK